MRLTRAIGWTVLLTLLSVGPVQADVDLKIVPDVIYGHKDGMALTLDVYKPKQAANGAGVLLMVSGGWYSPWTPPDPSNPFIQPLLKAGFTVFAVRHGSSPRYVVPEIVEDVRRSVRFIRRNADRFGVDPDRLGVTGGSAGGHLSLMLGTAADNGDLKAKDPVLRDSDRVAAVVAYFPPTDLRAWVEETSSYRKNFPALRITKEQAAAASPLLHVSSDDPPTLLISGDKDELVPIDHSQNILKAFEEHGVEAELVTIEGAGHGFPGEQGERASQALVEWFNKHLTEN
jgi:acetyl esterase/lipase